VAATRAPQRWGMSRSAQAAHPSRIVLADLDGDVGSWALLPAAPAAGSLRWSSAGAVRVPPPGPHRHHHCRGRPPERTGTVLVAGGTGTRHHLRPPLRCRPTPNLEILDAVNSTDPEPGID